MHAQRAAQTAPPAVTAPRVTATRRTPSRLTTIVVMAVTAVALLGLAYVTNSRPTATTTGDLQRVDLLGTPEGPGPIVGQPRPDLSVTTLDGQTMKLSDLQGKVVWLTFGASWCQPCRAENPDIEAAYETWKDKGVVVVQMYMNEDAATVTDYTNRVGITYTRVPDSTGQYSIEYRILGIPTHFFVDRNGVLQRLKVGTLSPDEMTQILTELAG